MSDSEQVDDAEQPIEAALPMPEDGKWTIRGMQAVDREAARAAARRAGLNVAEWLGEAIRARVAHERGTVYGEIDRPKAKPIPSLNELTQALMLAKEIAMLRERPIPKGQLSRASGLLSLYLRALPPPDTSN